MINPLWGEMLWLLKWAFCWVHFMFVHEFFDPRVVGFINSMLAFERICKKPPHRCQKRKSILNFKLSHPLSFLGACQNYRDDILDVRFSFWEDIFSQRKNHPTQNRPQPGEVEILQGLWSFTAEVWNSISQELRVRKHAKRCWMERNPGSLRGEKW